MSYRIFENILETERYHHLKALAFLAHLVESQYLSISRLQDIEKLVNYFDKVFVSFYSVKQDSFFLLQLFFVTKERHAVSVIHSIRHFYTCVCDYGPMFNYSTFSFESSMGLLLILSLSDIFVYIYE